MYQPLELLFIGLRQALYWHVVDELDQLDLVLCLSPHLEGFRHSLGLHLRVFSVEQHLQTVELLEHHGFAHIVCLFIPSSFKSVCVLVEILDQTILLVSGASIIFLFEFKRFGRKAQPVPRILSVSLGFHSR